jgi:hypothetical protein
MNGFSPATDNLKPPFDQLALERSVLALCKVHFRTAPLTLERVKAWVRQFESAPEKTLAWLVLRQLVYRTNQQLESCLRQALKAATIHFTQPELHGQWQDVLSGRVGDTRFYCGPPALDAFTRPGKSGDVVTRLVGQRYQVDKYYPHSITSFSEDERYLVVDDGSYTGQQLQDFLREWRNNDYSDGRVAVVVGLAHKRAIKSINEQFPNVPVFFGELLTEQNSLSWHSSEWVTEGKWLHPKSAIETYLDLYQRVGPFQEPMEQGYGSLGLMLAFEHGIPDDSLQLLWDRSAKWIPLIDR